MIEMVSSTLLEVADDDDDEEEDDESTDPLLFFFRFLCAVGSGFGVASCFDLVRLTSNTPSSSSSSSSFLVDDLVRFFDP